MKGILHKDKENIEKDLLKSKPFEILETFLSCMTPIRFKIFKEICYKPGISFKELREKLKIPKGTISKSLKILEKHKLIHMEYEVDEKTKKVKILIYPNKDFLLIAKKELELLYIKSKKR